MNRTEHLDWVKERALKELDYYPGDEAINNAFASLASDMNKHDETQNHPAIPLGLMMLANGLMGTRIKCGNSSMDADRSCPTCCEFHDESTL